MSIAAFLRDLAARDVKITLKGDRLQLNATEGVLTSALRAEIGAKKAEIITFLQNATRAQASEFLLRQADRNKPLPLSFAQQRLWFLHKLDPETPVYNLGASIRVPGAVDAATLDKSLQDLARRHEVLRTVFEEVDGVPSQVVTDTLPVLSVADVTHLPEEKREEEMSRLVDAEVGRPFDLAGTPAFRALLVRLGDDSAVLVLVVHHILADGWSLGLLVKEIGEIYAAMESGGSTALAEMPSQYVDYAYSEQRWFEESNQQVHMDYWKEKLSGTLSSIDLPLDHPRERVLGSKGASHTFTIPAELANKLRALSRQSGVTLFTTLLAVYKTLLHRYSDQGDIIVGTAVSNRRNVELEALVGMFVSTLVLRTDLSGDPSVHELLRRVHNTVLDAREHQDYPFEKLMDLVQIERNLSHSPLFQAAFVLHNTPLRGTYTNVGAGSMFELSLYVWDGADSLSALLEYNTDLFNADTIERLAGHLLTLANEVVTNPDQAISKLAMLTDAERTQLLEEWNRTDVNYSAQCIHTLFERQADATPDAVAVISGDLAEGEPQRQLTYRELDQLANKLAHRLRQVGVVPDSTVAIALDRSVDLVVAVLGVWKAGGAYVPLDPTYPNDRLAFMLGDARVVAMVTKASVQAAIPAIACPIIDIDLLNTSGMKKGEARPPAMSESSNLAYVIYTSGSTGRPKGVMVEHRSVANILQSAQREPGLAATDRLLSVTTLSFDIAVVEIWLPLTTGGCVVLATRAATMDGERLGRQITASGATVIQATPVTWRLLIESGWRDGNGRKIISGGEALSKQLADMLLATGAELWNGYGPTETSIYSTFHHVGSDRDPIPIGRPIANTKLYILDQNREPVPVNVAGELYIGGAGVTRGYFDRPELTAERFVRNPFVAATDARMYRTGDQTRYRADGTVEYLGRLDNQVKIRGFRIELGEIESALAAHDGVQDAVVVAYEDKPGDQRMVAYLVGPGGDSINSLELRRWLSELLPQYMIPSAFVFVDAFPHTPNGKVDRRALLATGLGTQQLSQSSTPPRPGLETLVAQVWRDTLGVEQVWADDNFFQLGGNSLLGVRLLSNLEKVIGKRLPVSVLFEGQTVRAMAAVLGHDSDDDALSLAVRIKSGSNDRPPLFIIPGINGNVIGYETLAQSLPDEQRVYGLRSVGLNGETEPLDRLEMIAKRFLEDVRKVQPNGPYNFGGFCIGGIVAYEMAQQLVAQGEQVDMLALIGTWPPYSVEDMVSTSPSAQKLAFLREGIARHLHAMLEQPRGQRLAYLRTKARIVVEMLVRRDVYRGDTETLHHDWVSGTNRRAAARYAPSQYSGDAFLVIPSSIDIPEEHDARFHWKTLVQGSSTVVRLPGEDSGALLRPPYIQHLADVLSQRLATASAIVGTP